MKFFTALIALTAFVAAQAGEQGAQADMMVTAQQANSNGNQSQMKEYPLPPSQQVNSNGNQNQTKEYPLPPSQSGNNSNGTQTANNSSGNQNGSQAGNQEQKSYPIPMPSQIPGANNQVVMEEFQKFLESPMIKKFMEYMKSAQQNKF